MEIVFMIVISFVFIVIGIHYQVEYSIHRNQVLLLQMQRRNEKKHGLLFSPVIEGLWPDLDVESRLRTQLAEAEARIFEAEGGG